jgi:hypothetical protein
MFKKMASKIKQVIFKAQKIQADGPMAKAQAKIIDDLLNQADAVAEIAKDAAKNIVADAKQEVAKAAKKATAPKPSKVGPRPEDAARAAKSTQAKKGRPKKSAK